MPASEIPAAVKTEGFYYYGLDNAKPFAMEKVNGSATDKGSSITKLVRVVNGNAFFDITYTGGLVALTPSRVEATKTGIYTVRMSDTDLPHPQLELPADPKPGYSWTVKATFNDAGGDEIHANESDRIVGIQSITVNGRRYKALYVEGHGTFSNGGNQYPYEGKKWFVKGLGAVKIVSKTKTQNGQSLTMTVQAAQ